MIDLLSFRPLLRLMLLLVFIICSIWPEAFAQSDYSHRVMNSVAATRQNANTQAVEWVSPAVVGINVTQVHRYIRKSPFAEDPFFRNFFPDIPFE